MGFAVVLRNNVSVNHFRNSMIGVMNFGGGDEAIICSGFFQENFKNNQYQATLECGFCGTPFYQALKNSNIHLTTVGIHNSTWSKSYSNFVNNLRNRGVNIRGLRKVSLRWHAKIFILKYGGEPVFGIIGSSNITRNAFSSTAPFNFEADVYMWKDGSIAGDFLDRYFNEIKNPYDIIRLSHDSLKNQGITIENRLKKIESEILQETYGEI